MAQKLSELVSNCIVGVGSMYYLLTLEHLFHYDPFGGLSIFYSIFCLPYQVYQR